MAILFITHDLGIVRKMADRVCVMQRRRGGGNRRGRRVVRQPATFLHPAIAGRRTQGRTAAGKDDAPEVMAGDDLKVWFPLKRGCWGGWPITSRRSMASTSRCGKDRPWAWWARAVPARPRLGLALLRLLSSEGRDLFPRVSASMGCRTRRCARCASPCRSCFRTRSVRSVPGCRWAKSWRKACWCMAWPGTAPPAVPGSLRRWRKSGWTRHPGPLSARVFRRPAPAHRHRPRPGLAAAPAGAGRADQRLGRVGAGADRRFVARVAASSPLGYVFISHDLRVVRALGQSSAGDEKRPGGGSGSGAARCSTIPKHPYTQALLAAALNLEATGNGVVAV
jgi:microcin C transport system ATP-binding protein